MVVASFKRNSEFKYKNFIQVFYEFIISELRIAMNYIGFYSIENEVWNKRKIVWSTILGIPTIAFILAIFIASIKYIIS